MITRIITLSVPEIRNYHREVIEGGIVITYEVRHPAERDWTPVKLFRFAEAEQAQHHDTSHNRAMAEASENCHHRDIDIGIDGL